MIPRLVNRTPVTHIARGDARHRRLESLAAEFALIAQRRSHLTQKMELLGRQYHAAAGTLTQLQARMASLARHIGALDPRPREAEASERQAASARGFKAMPAGMPGTLPRNMVRDLPREMPREMPRETSRETSGPAANPASLPAIGRRWLAARPGFHAPPKLPAAPASGKWRT